MRAVDLIARKRDGLALSDAEIQFFVRGFTSGDIPDYQASAWAMAIVWRGMTPEETTALTLAMAHSGEVLDLSSIAPMVADKHSSGGVGDKTTLVVAPWVAACGVPMGKMSGRGLAHTGGTLDKLESIPGFRVELTRAEFLSQLAAHGIVVCGQTHDLAPADGKLYALRDVTATVDSIPLIASSIMSKKIAAGAQAIVLDVKVGRGAFMKTEADAIALARLMVHIGQGAGRRVAAVISDMNQPLGDAVGNALEVVESVETLKGRGPEDFYEHCLAVAAEILMLAGAAADPAAAHARLEASLYSGQALAKFIEWVQAQGGDPAFAEDYTQLPQASLVEALPAPSDGYVKAIDALELGRTAMLLGGGRARKKDPIDPSVGLVLHTKIGCTVHAGDPLVTVYANDRSRLEVARVALGAAILVGSDPPQPLPPIHTTVRQ